MILLLSIPIFLTIWEIALFIRELKKNPFDESWAIDALVFIFGAIYARLYGVYKWITWEDWNVQLVNAERHSPIYTESLFTVTVIFIIAFAGYVLLQRKELTKMPPLVVVLSISAMYLGMIQLIVYTIQIVGAKIDNDPLDYSVIALPVCCGIITARTILRKIHDWKEQNTTNDKIRENKILCVADKILRKADLWPVLAFLLMFPLLGILIMILILFGQAPDSIIKAWTETSEWALSTKQSPPNLHVDEHYLCTVAAGGHRKIVKPIRKGIRHGHEVIVNRQLCIANAFEEVLQEKTPRAHRLIRGFYDKYGFPVAKLIRHKWSADIVYFLMKPLEWIFLIVLYSTDVHPENRIAVQYAGDKK